MGTKQEAFTRAINKACPDAIEQLERIVARTKPNAMCADCDRPIRTNWGWCPHCGSEINRATQRNMGLTAP